MLEWFAKIFLWVWGIGFFLALIRSWKPSQVIGHWRNFFPDSNVATLEFYNDLSEVLRNSNIPELETRQVEISTGMRLLSSKRVYLRVSSFERVIDICAAPYGNGFFVSWWLFEKEKTWKLILNTLPWIGPKLIEYLDPITYYRYDTAIMFQSIVHSCLLDMIDKFTEGKGMRLSEQEKKPQLIDVFKR